MDETTAIPAGHGASAADAALDAAERAYAAAVAAADAAMAAFQAAQAAPNGWQHAVMAAGAQLAEARAHRDRLGATLRRARG